MPTYEYVCEKCGYEFDYVQSMKDPRLTECILEECRGPVHRKIGRGAGIIFKGTGFYETDYRKDAYKSDAKKDSDASGSASAPAPAGSGEASPAKTTSDAPNSSSTAAAAASPPPAAAPAKSADSGAKPGGG